MSQAGRVQWIEQMIQRSGPLPGRVVDAQFLELRIGDNVLGPADYWFFARIELTPKESERWLQALAARVPVVTSNTSCLPEVARDGAALVDPKSPVELAAAIEHLLESPGDRAKLAGYGGDALALRATVSPDCSEDSSGDIVPFVLDPIAPAGSLTAFVNASEPFAKATGERQ